MLASLVRGTPCNNRVRNNQGWFAGLGAGLGQKFCKSGCVVGVLELKHLPAIGGKAFGYVFGKRDIGRAFDGNPVGIIDPCQVAQFQVCGKGSGLAGYAFHHVPIPAQGVHMVVEQRKTGHVVARGQPFFGNGHAYGIATACTQRPCCGFHPRCVAVFGVAGSFGTKLAELAEVFHAQGRFVRNLAVGNLPDACNMNKRVKQHGAWPMDSTKRSRLGQSGAVGS